MSADCDPVPFRSPRRTQRGGFTLVELLTVIAIIGILAALVIPTASGVRRSAEKAHSRVKFSQWAAAIESFRSEYGYYPDFGPANLVNPVGQETAANSLHLFHDLLAAKRRDGTALPAYSGINSSTAPEAQNRKLMVFFAFAESDYTERESDRPNLLKDGSDNTEIAVLIDQNLDGVIDDSDYGTLPAVAGMRPDESDIPRSGIRAGVVFYAPAPGATTSDPRFIYSWKPSAP